MYDYVVVYECSSDFDADGVKEESFKAFGEELISSGNYTDNHRFTGKEYENSDVYYFGARYYDPLLGRFLNPDPVGSFEKYDPMTTNPFVYCTNNPLRYVDPNGEIRMETVEVGARQIGLGSAGIVGGTATIKVGLATSPIGVGFALQGLGLVTVVAGMAEVGTGIGNVTGGLFNDSKPVAGPFEQIGNELAGKAGVVAVRSADLALSVITAGNDPISMVIIMERAAALVDAIEATAKQGLTEKTIDAMKKTRREQNPSEDEVKKDEMYPLPPSRYDQDQWDQWDDDIRK